MIYQQYYGFQEFKEKREGMRNVKGRAREAGPMSDKIDGKNDQRAPVVERAFFGAHDVHGRS